MFAVFGKPRAEEEVRRGLVHDKQKGIWYEDRRHWKRLGKVAETIDNIGKRYTERGKFIATGDELRLLQQTADRFKAALGMAAWKHYVRAIKESEPILDAEAHRKREKQEG